jgi:hypothetical protein
VPRSARTSEAEVAALVVAWLEEQGHDVYQEVALGSSIGGGVADIVCLVGPQREVWIVEVKAGWSLDLIEQCLDRRRRAHRVFAAVPHARTNHSAILRELGVGTFVVRMGDQFVPTRVELDSYWMPPRLTSRHDYSPFRATCDALLTVVGAHEGLTLKEAVSKTAHHYSTPATAVSSLAKWIEKGVVDGIELRIESGKRRLYLRRVA